MNVILSKQDRNKIYQHALNRMLEQLTRETFMCNELCLSIYHLNKDYSYAEAEDRREQLIEFWDFAPIAENQHAWFTPDTGFADRNCYLSQEVKDIQKIILLFCIEMTND